MEQKDNEKPEPGLAGVFHVKHADGTIEQFSFKSVNRVPQEETIGENNGVSRTSDGHSESDC